MVVGPSGPKGIGILLGGSRKVDWEQAWPAEGPRSSSNSRRASCSSVGGLARSPWDR